jgi:pimeloyl-ACP methyl ester carboxylesterase
MEKDLNVNGARLSIIDQGSGPAVLFIHGLGGYKENWEDNIDYFARGHRAIAVDLPGFGNSDKRSELSYGIEFFSKTLSAMLEQLGIDKAHWVGNSMGGHVAAFTAIHNPTKVDKLVLVDAAGTNSEQIKLLLASQGAMLNNPAFKPSPELIGMMMRTMIFYGPCAQADKMIKKAIDDLARPDASARQGAVMKALQSIIDTPLNDQLPQIKARTSVVWGKNDNLINVASANTFLEKIKGAKLHVIENCGHCPMLEKSDDFNRIVGEFLAS